MQRLTPFTCWLLFLCRRLCGRHGSPSCSVLRCFVSSHLVGSRPPTRVTRRARTPGEGSPRAAHFTAARRGRAGPPTVQKTAPPRGTHSRRRLRRPASSDPWRVCPLPSRSPDHAPAPPKLLTPRWAAPPRHTRPTDSCKGFPLLVAVATCRQLVLNFDPDSFLILEYF